MPFFPWPVSSHAIYVPKVLYPSTISGSTLGSIGSKNGGKKNRLPFCPCWWMSCTIWGCQ